MATIGLISAMTQERNALLRLVGPWKRTTIGKLTACTFSISGHSYVLVTSGMGDRRASEAARLLSDVYTPQLLISFGIAGAVEADLEIGDVVLAEACTRMDQGIPGATLPLASWPETAREAAAQALNKLDARLYIGIALTTRGSQIAYPLPRDWKHPILEMETAGIAQVAAVKGIPLLSLRTISDGPRAPIPLDVGEVMDEDANLKIGKLIGMVLRKPKIVLQSARIMQNIRTATDHAALALVAALSGGLPGRDQ